MKSSIFFSKHYVLGMMSGVLLLCQPVAYAGSSSQEIPIVVTVNPVCVLSLNVTTLSFDLIANYANSANTTLTIECTPQSSVSLNITSVNSWKLIGITHQNEIPYVVSYTGGGYIVGATVNPTWSGQAAGTEVLAGTAQSTAWQIPLSFSFPNIGRTHSVDNYADSITFSAVY